MDGRTEDKKYKKKQKQILSKDYKGQEIVETHEHHRPEGTRNMEDEELLANYCLNFIMNDNILMRYPGLPMVTIYLI